MNMQTLQQPEVVQAIKEKELTTGKKGHFFVAKEKGVMRVVKLALENDLLIVDSTVVLDMNQVQIMICH